MRSWHIDGNERRLSLPDGSDLVVTVSDKSPLQVAYEKLMTARAVACDCPGCRRAVTRHHSHNTRTIVANFMRVSDAAVRCTDDDKRFGVSAL